VAELEKENHELGKRIDFAYESVKADKAEVDRLCGCVQRRDDTIADFRAKLLERFGKSIAAKADAEIEQLKLDNFKPKLSAAGGGVFPCDPSKEIWNPRTFFVVRNSDRTMMREWTKRESAEQFKAAIERDMPAEGELTITEVFQCELQPAIAVAALRQAGGGE